MTNKRIYNFFLFLSTLTRSLVEVFSVILLYNKGYSINNILFFLLVMYLSGILVNYLSLIINYKVVLVFSISTSYIAKICLPIVTTCFLDQIQELVAVAGLK